MENRTAYFTNNYYLPKKFNIDLRYSEFSALIRSGQMSRDEAIDKINTPKEFDKGILEEVQKRLGLTNAEFEKIMSLPKHTYHDYKTYKRLFEKLRPFFWFMYKTDYITKSFYVKYAQKN